MGWHPVALPLLGLGLLAAGCRRIGSGQRGGSFSTQNETPWPPVWKPPAA